MPNEADETRNIQHEQRPLVSSRSRSPSIDKKSTRHSRSRTKDRKHSRRRHSPRKTSSSASLSSSSSSSSSLSSSSRSTSRHRRHHRRYSSPSRHRRHGKSYRERSKHRSEYHSSRKYEKSPVEYRQRSSRGGSKSPARSRHSSTARPLEKKPGSSSPPPAAVELTESERDRRTVFVQQLAAKLKSEDLRTFLSRVGKIRDVKIVTDRITGRSKGFGYVEFYEEQSVPLAIMLSGQKLMGVPIIIAYTESEKNRLAEEASEAARRSRHPDNQYHRLYVSSIHPNINEENLRLLFEPYGQIELLQLHRDPITQKSKGFGFIQYKEHQDARTAFEQLNGLSLAGMNMRVGVVSEKYISNSGSGLSSSASAAANASSTLDDADTHGMAMTAQSRTDLMLKLARDTDLLNHAPLSGKSALANDTHEPSMYILLSNVYDIDIESELTWAKDLAEDIHEECLKFGPISFLHVAKSKAGEVYIKYGDVTSAQLAVAALQGRWFGGRQITCKFISPTLFQARMGRL